MDELVIGMSCGLLSGLFRLRGILSRFRPLSPTPLEVGVGGRWANMVVVDSLFIKQLDDSPTRYEPSVKRVP
jgi:hypothetical protein